MTRLPQNALSIGSRAEPAIYNVRHVPAVARRAFLSAVDNGLFHFAKSASYSALLCLLPITATAAAVFTRIRADDAEQILVRFLSRILPPGTASIVTQPFTTTGEKPSGLLITALAFSVFAASNVLTTFMDGFSAAYKIRKQRSLFVETTLGIALVFACAAPLTAAIALILSGDAVGAWALNLERIVDPGWHPVAAEVFFSETVHFVVAFSATVSVMLILYHFAPNRRQGWLSVLPGALLTSCLWLGLTAASGWYFTRVSNYNVLYGSVGASMVLLTWMYLLSAAVLVGCEFNAEWERR